MKFYSKIFETAKKIFPDDNEWLEYDTILSKRIYLEDVNEENWVINLQELFNSGKSPLSPQRRHTDKGGWERYDLSGKNTSPSRYSKLEDAVKQRKIRDQMIKHESIDHKRPKRENNNKLLSISVISKSDSKPRDNEKMMQKQQNSILNRNLILPTIVLDQFQTQQIVSPWSGNTIQSPLAGFALPLGKRNKRSQSIHHC